MSTRANASNFLERLVDALRLAALAPEEQIAALPDFVHVPDEIALLYDEAFELVPQIRDAELINNAQLEPLAQLDSLFEEMSTSPDGDWLWTAEAMRTDERWNRSRELAADALAALERSPGPPRLDGITWISGRPSSDPV